MTVRLRAHHLLCLLTYAGKGYTPAFTANFDVIADRLDQGEDIGIVAGSDDICEALLCEAAPHCLKESPTRRDRQAARDVTALLGTPIRPGAGLSLSRERLALMREAFSAGAIRSACAGCEWHDLCSGIASRDYDGVRISGR